MDQFIKEVVEAELHPNHMKEEDMRQKVFTKGRRILCAYFTWAFINASPQFPLPICWSPVKGGIYVISETVHILTFSTVLARKTIVQCPHFLNFTISQYVWACYFPTYVIDPFKYPNSLIICLDIILLSR